MLNEMAPARLLEMIEQNESVHIIDIREDYEYEDGHLPCVHMPMETVFERADELPRDRPVVVYCQSSKRSSAMVYMLQRENGLDNVYSLTGGYAAIAELVN